MTGGGSWDHTDRMYSFHAAWSGRKGCLGIVIVSFGSAVWSGTVEAEDICTD
jgi:hypothetical protein